MINILKLKFDERRDIINYIENTEKIETNEIRSAIWKATIYYSKINPAENLFDTIIDYMESKNNTFRYEEYLSTIDKCIRRVERYSMKYVGDVYITKNEMNLIQSFNDIKKEKIVFVLIALAKYFNILNQTDSNMLFAKTSEIFKMAKVAIPSKDRDFYNQFLYKEGILRPNTSVGYNLLIVDVIDSSTDEPELILDEYDFQELAYTYLNYKQGGYKRCKACQRWFKLKKGAPAQRYCSSHQTVLEKKPYKIISCKECGVDMVVSLKNHKTQWCKECQRLRNNQSKNRYYHENKES